jgi:hypothetical protein
MGVELPQVSFISPDFQELLLTFEVGSLVIFFAKIARVARR